MTTELNNGQPLAGPISREAKTQEVLQKTPAKQAEIDPQAAQQRYQDDIQKLDTYSLGLKYGREGVIDQLQYQLGQNLSGRIDKMDRSGGEVVQDTGLAAGKGGVNTVGFISQLARSAGQGMAVLGQNWSNPEQAVKNMHAVEAGNARSQAAVNDTLNNVNESLSAKQSLRSQLAEYRTGIDMQARQEANNAQYEADLAAGKSPSVATMEKLMRGAIDGVSAVTKDSTYLGNFIGEQAASALIGPGAKAAAGVEVAAKAGLKGELKGEYLKTYLGKKQLDSAAKRNLAIGVGVTEATGSGQQSFNQVMQMKPEDLEKNSPDYAKLIQEGYSADDAKAVLAQRAANTAMVIQGPAAALTSKIAARFELDPLSGGGTTGAGRVMHALSNMGKESLEETLQSGTGQLAQNIGVQTHADRTQSLSDGVGEQAGMGAVGAVGLTSAMQAPSTAAGVAKVTGTATAKAATDLARAGGSAAVSAGRTAGTAALDKLKTIAERRTKLSDADQAAVDAEVESRTIPAIAREYAQADGSVESATPEQSAPLPEEKAVASKTQVPQTATPVGKDRLTKFGRLYEIRSSPHIESVSHDDQMQLAANAYMALKGMTAERNQLLQQLEENPDNPVAMARAEALTKAIQSDAGLEVADYAKQNSAALTELVKSGQVIPDIIDHVTPQLEQAARSVQQAATLSPESVPQPLYQKILNNAQKLGLSQQQVTQLKGAKQIGALTAHKGIDFVNKDVTEGSGNGFVSLREHLENIHGNLAANDMQGAQQSLEGLRKFAQHMTDKSRDFTRAHQQYLANPANGAVNVVRADGNPYNSLVNAKTGTAKPMTASRASEKLMEQIHAEATLLANNYNQVLADHPALKGTGSKITVPALNLSGTDAAQPAAQTQSPKTDFTRESTTGTGVFNGERELTRPEMQDLASGEVTIADLKAKWADEAKAAEPAATTEQPAEQIKEPVSEPVSAPEPVETRAESAPAEVDTADQTRENTPEPAPAADPVTANPEPVTPQSETAEEPQNAPSESPEPVADNPAASEPVVTEEAPQTGAERMFATLTPKLEREKKEGHTDIDHADRVENAVLKYFTPVAGKSLMARTPGFMASLKTALQGNGAELGKLLNLKDTESLGLEQRNALLFLSQINDQFRQNLLGPLNQKLATYKQNGKAHTDPNQIQWRNSPILYFSRMKTADDGSQVIASPSRHLTDAMAMTTVKFALDNLRPATAIDDETIADQLGIDASDVTAELQEAFADGNQSFALVAQRLAQSMNRAIGMKANDNAPENIADGIPLSLAQDSLNLLASMKLAEITNIRIRLSTPDAKDGKEFRDIKSIRFLGKKGETLNNLDKALGTQLDLTSRMFDPESKTSAYIDKVPRNASKRQGRSRVQLLSNKLERYQSKLQQIPFFLNADLHDLVSGMGTENMAKMLGHSSLEGLNKVHARTVKGQNQSIMSAIETFESGMRDLEAAAGDRALHDVPVHFRWNVGSNLRGMMQSSTFNPQRHKYHRELMTITPVTLKVNNKAHIRDFTLAVAQSLGVDIDRISNRNAARELNTKLNTPVYRSAINVLRSQLGDYSRLSPSDVAAITDAVNEAGQGMKSFHGLLAQAKYESALHNGEETFSNHLTMELDGKTDGPAHAIVQMGTVVLGKKLRALLAKVGLFINSDDMALNVFSEGNKDIYETVSETADAMMRAQYKGETTPNLQAQMTLLAKAKMVKYDNINDSSTYSTKRSIAKGPVTQTVYSSSPTSIREKLRNEMLDVVYAGLSEAMAKETVLDEDIRNAAIRLTGAKELEDPRTYANFEFAKHHIEKMDKIFENGMGGIMNSAIGDTLKFVIDSSDKIRDAANAQHSVFEAAFNAARERKLAALIASGETASYNDLTKQQIQDVYDEVAHLAPIYHTSLSDGVTPRQGMLMSTELSGGKGAKKVESIFGGGTEVPTLRFGAPNARPAPMLTIASGDATMMADYFLKGGQALNMYDGLEVMPGQLNAAAADINSSVFKAWQYDLAGTVHESMAGSMKDATVADFEAMPVEMLDQQLAKDRYRFKPVPTASIEEKAQYLFERMQKIIEDVGDVADKTASVKQVIFNHFKTSTDHMAGNQTPVVNRADLASVPESKVDQMLFMEAVEHKARRVEASDPQSSSYGNPTADAAILRHLSDQKPVSRDGVTTYSRAQSVEALRNYLDEVAGKKARIPQFVLSQVEKYLPEDLQMHVGDDTPLKQHIMENFPDLGDVDLNETNGMYWGSQIFLKNHSGETMLHEMVHAATRNQLHNYFYDPQQLNASQRESVTALNRIMNDFLASNEDNPLIELSDKSQRVQATIRQLVESGNREEALNEFVAWSLTNPALAEDLQKAENKNKETHIIERVLKIIARLLGIGTAAQSYFVSIAGHTANVMRNVPSRSTGNRAAPLNQLNLDTLNSQLRSERTTTAHQAHLNLTFNRLQSTLINRIKATQQPVAGITTAADRLDFDKLDPAISQAASAFMASGFPMSGQEEMVFKMTQASLQTAFEAKPANAIEARRMFTEASRALTPGDLVDGTGSMVMAQMRYDALFGEGLPAAEQLANFLAASQTSELLRSKLREKFVKPERAGEKTWEDRAVGAVNDAIRWTANLGTGMGRSLEMQKRLDILSKNLTHFEAEARQSVIEKATSGIGDSLDQVNNYVNQKKANGAKWLAENTDSITTKIANENARLAASGILRGIAAMGSKRVSGDVAESMLSMINSGTKDKLLNPLQSLGAELIGITDSNRAVLNLLTRAKPLVDKVRQILREQVPELVAERFSQPLTAQQSSALHSGLGKTDAAALLNHGYQVSDLARLYSDSAYRAQEIAAAKQAVTGQHAQEQLHAADALAHFMVTGEVVNQHLLPNAQLIATLAGTKLKVDQSGLQQRVDAIDKLVSLQAIDKLPAQAQADVSAVMARELKANAADNGATFVLNLMNNLRANEGKRLSTMNTVKGAMHTTFDTHKSVVVATPKQGADLIKRGYIKGAEFKGDPGNAHGVMHYYTSTEGGRPQWNQGAMQTVQATAGGVDPYTGRLRSPVSAPRLSGQQAKLERTKRAGAIYQGRAFKANGFTNNMRPVFDINGNVSSYEYSVPHAVRDAMLNANTDLGHNLGVWNGRIVEEELSQAFNRELVKALHHRHTEDMKTVGREDEFVTINAGHKDPQVREAWSLMPVEMREMVKEVFGGDLVVRKDMLDNALGFRRASVNEIWEGNSRLSPMMQNLIYSVATSVLGNDAARVLRKGERFVQEAVSSAKDWIVVRSLVVARDNIISNNIQLLGHGMSPLQIVRKSAEAMTLVDAYQKNERRLNELSLLLGNQADTARHAAYRREMAMLRTENERSPIHPLVMDGHLPTIAEGLSENDDYSLRNDFNGWINRQTAKLPNGVTTAARYALIARGTPVYAGLNRMIQYGDFTAKYALYDHLQTRKREKMDQQGALKLLQDEFVNYSILPSRSRDYLESMGATWFLNYKLRIQKILLRSIRDNPLRFLLTAGAAGAMDIPGVLESNLVTNSVKPNLGWGALFRAHETHPLWWLVD